jgi:hypothetical protein
MADTALGGKHFGTTTGIRGALGGRHRLNQGERQQADEGQTQRSEHRKTTLEIHAFVSRRTPTLKMPRQRCFGRLERIVGGRRHTGFALRASCIGRAAKPANLACTTN